MKEGRTIGNLWDEIERLASTRVDYVVPTDKMSARVATLEPPRPDAPEPKRIELFISGHGPRPIRPHAHSQLATYLKIPGDYYNRLQIEHPNLLARSINTLMHAKKGDARLVRELEGNVRAVLWNRYRPLDNWELMQAVMPYLMDIPDLRPVSCEVTESRLYVKLVTPRLTGEVQVGDVVRGGVLIRNSEIGQGRLAALPFIERLSCRNGATFEIYGMRKNHTGARLTYGGEFGDDANEDYTVFSDETRRLSDAALFSQFCDVIRNVLNPGTFEKILEKLKQASNLPMGHDAIANVEVLAERFQLSEAEKKGVTNNLMNSAMLNAWGVGNAVTRIAEDAESYDRASELEVIGGRIFTMDPKEWNNLITLKPKSRDKAANN